MMPTLLLRLVGPMQSWGVTSRFQERDTAPEPSKSGVLGLLCAAMGICRENWTDLEPLTRLRFGTRRDRPGVVRYDYHSAGAHKGDRMMKADGKLSQDGIVSKRYYLANAAFLAGLEGMEQERALLEKAHAALQNPVWHLFLGRKSFVPSEPVWLESGIRDEPLEVALTTHFCLDPRREKGKGEALLLSLEARAQEGTLRMDQPLSSFAERRFGSRYVVSRSVPCPEPLTGETDVPA